MWPAELPGAVGRGAKPPTPQKIRNFEYAFWFPAMAGYLNEGLVGGHRTTCAITPAPVWDRLECHFCPSAGGARAAAALGRPSEDAGTGQAQEHGHQGQPVGWVEPLAKPIEA
jgi:hypothetical protein